jgi:hypothetical protein
MASFTEYFKKWPQNFSEMTVIKDIHKTIECAQHELKEKKEGTEHLKYMAEAYEKISDYFKSKGLDPNQFL